MDRQHCRYKTYVFLNNQSFIYSSLLEIRRALATVDLPPPRSYPLVHIVHVCNRNLVPMHVEYRYYSAYVTDSVAIV